MIFLFALVLLLALAMIPVGLPGTWVMIAAAIALGFASAAVHVGWVVIGGCVVIAIIAEALDVVLAARYTKRYGGSRRGAWGAFIGGIVGAVVGVPMPVIGSVLGAIAGSFIGALVAEVSGGAAHDAAARAATGAAIGRAFAMATKVAAGAVIAAWMLGAALL